MTIHCMDHVGIVVDDLAAATAFAQLGLDMRPVLINGVAGVVSFLHGEPFSLSAATVRGGKIVDWTSSPTRSGSASWT
jgi:catechol 2,3-dioxygenase-like lactoylglutathione lyase family enzyme